VAVIGEIKFGSLRAVELFPMPELMDGSVARTSVGGVIKR
jgi:hypothetical protein